jgi:hypothetical protein
MSQVETRTKYLVELETGIGFSNKGGYAVFTGHRWCKTKREALAVANKLCRDKPLFQVRITREFRRREVVMTFLPETPTNEAHDAKRGGV